jgi:hypothetical protein
MSDKYFLWPPENQRTQILTMAARLAEEGNPVTDPHANFVQFRKDIRWAIRGSSSVRLS